MLEIFALIVLGVICAAAIWLIVIIGNLPGNIARAADHPQAEAISILAWVGLLTAGVGWLVALVWSKMKPIAPSAALEQRVAVLEKQLQSKEVDA